MVKMKNKTKTNQPSGYRSPEHGIGWMAERESSGTEEMSLSDRLYRTPLVLVAGFFAAAGVILCIFTLLIALIFGLRVYNDETESGEAVRYFGIMRGETPVWGTIYLPDGERGRVLSDKVRFTDGRRYEGGLLGLFFEGDGVLTDADGNVYKGSFENGYLEGECTIEFSDGSTFAGSFVHGERDGYGEYVGADGSSYKGYYSEDEKSGYGVLTYTDGSVYKGYFQNGMRHGEGTYRFASGDTYTGEFRNNVISGQGSYFFVSGRVFSGEFRNGVPVIE